ncbi:MAG: phage protein [Acidobacteriota bacterium]
MSNTRAYTADQVTILIASAIIDSGYADGEFLLIQEDAPRIIKVVGSDGEVAISKNLNRAATITLKLLSTSAGNNILSALMNLNSDGDGIGGIGPLSIRDRAGSSLHEAPACWVEQAPSVSYDRSATSREWIIGVGHLTNFIGGNAIVG